MENVVKVFNEPGSSAEEIFPALCVLFFYDAKNKFESVDDIAIFSFHDSLYLASLPLP